MTHNISEIAQAWVETQTIIQKIDIKNEDFWAQDLLDELTINDPIKAIHVIVEISRISDDEEVLSHLGAGPIESLMLSNGGKVIKIIEKESKINRNFKKALKVVEIEEHETSAYQKFYEIAETKPY